VLGSTRPMRDRHRGRTIIVGDLHGCRDELDSLLGWVGFGSGDRLVVVGDVATRGPDPRGTVRLLRQLGAVGVRGNHEDRLLARIDGRLARRDPYQGLVGRAARELREKDVEWLRALPLWLDLPEHGLTVVHAGLLPGKAIREQTPETLMYLRTIEHDGERVPWAEAWDGPPHVVFGHHAVLGLQVHRAATGIDTACVYGGRLTALVLRRGEHPPPARDRLDALVSVPARRSYVGGRVPTRPRRVGGKLSWPSLAGARASEPPKQLAEPPESRSRQGDLRR
jgi:hypothetical protein